MGPGRRPPASRAGATAMSRLRDHAETSAAALEAAGLPARAVALVREQAAPSDPEFGHRFHAADEAC